jgi:hypothetical protein
MIAVTVRATDRRRLDRKRDPSSVDGGSAFGCSASATISANARRICSSLRALRRRQIRRPPTSTAGMRVSAT